jgi:SAM-dependent methyltransferase
MEILSQDWRILHFAPEPPLRRILSCQQRLDYVTGDLDPRFADLEVDITELQFEDDSFDLVLCSHVLEHVPDDGSAMREVRRVLKPTGRALFQQPIDFSRAVTYEDPSIIDPAARLREFGQGDHVRYYGRDFPQRLVAAGLDVEEEGYELDDRAEGEYYGIVESGDRRGSDIYVGRPAATLRSRT